jgi:hypothetical protein
MRHFLVLLGACLLIGGCRSRGEIDWEKYWQNGDMCPGGPDQLGQPPRDKQPVSQLDKDCAPALPPRVDTSHPNP